ncbi:5-oxoprolinase subunit B family protein [Gephyromycinifex aptenodytis]|uniref:5-oxoprolinase subunit B family protein n=1 Tax=Gephyromycinifex aptenodytis TaxID=2716227 RepID=UPI001447C224|nr:carboxyltransferase domain-containing protein [Gephyromycinifex aptenodytis]
MSISVHRLGQEGLLIELPGLAQVLALDAALRAARESSAQAVTATQSLPPADPSVALGAVVDVVPAARTLMLTVASPAQLCSVEEAVRALVGTTDLDTGEYAAGDSIEIPVYYDGPDLEEVADITGLGRRGVIEVHTGTPWQVAFGGFAPGFFYLLGGDHRLVVPRRREPRTTVPDGAVALAGGFSAVYPRSSPGGWQLLGRTDTVMWDTSASPPALLRPGMRVRFTDADLS